MLIIWWHKHTHTYLVSRNSGQLVVSFIMEIYVTYYNFAHVWYWDRKWARFSIKQRFSGLSFPSPPQSTKRRFWQDFRQQLTLYLACLGRVVTSPKSDKVCRQFFFSMRFFKAKVVYYLTPRDHREKPPFLRCDSFGIKNVFLYIDSFTFWSDIKEVKL